MSALIALFSGLDRLGPGSAESLRWALGLARTEKTAQILDAGCGTGADIGVLSAAVPQGRLVAIDSQPEMIARVKTRFPRIEAHVADMLDPPGGPFDLIWSAGSVCFPGVTKALTAWKSHLKAGGIVAFSELCARVESPPEEVTSFWASKKAILRTAADLEAEVAAAGYEVLAARWVGPAGWASYYGPLEGELDGFDQDEGFVATLRAEISLWRTHGVTYGYRLIVAKAI